MPGSKFKKSYSKKRYSKKSYSKKSEKKRLRKFASKMSKMVGEKKYADFDYQITNLVDSAGVITSLSDIGQGDADNERDGDQLTLTSLDFRYFWNMSGSVESTRVRTLIFQWYPPTIPIVTDILLFNALPATPLDVRFMAPYSHDRRFNFRVLYDKTHLMTYQALAGANPNSYTSAQLVRVIKFARDRIQYIGGGVTGTNKVYVLFISDAPAGTPARPNVKYITKLNYHDN